MIGEAGPEAVVPLNRWDALSGGIGGAGGLNLNFAPVINVSGNAAASDLQAGLKAGADDLMERLNAALANERRLSYA
jgi:hypothetical protein